MAATEERHALLEQLGRYYGQEHFAVAFTGTNNGENAKRVLEQGWDRTRPLAGADFGAALIAGRGATRNIAIVLRPSNLIVVECDSEEDLVRVTELTLPQTLTVQSSAAYKRHFYFRPAPEQEHLPYVAFRFENGKLTADSGRYFLAPPSIHPSGAIYSFLAGLGPGETDIAELPEHTYRDLAKQAGLSQRTAQLEPGAPIAAGARDQTLASIAGGMRRRGATQREILAALRVVNEDRCLPPLDDRDVERISASIARYTPAATNGAAPRATAEREVDPPEEEPPALRLETWHEFESQAHEPMRLLIDGLWPEGAFGFLAAPPKQGKTWVGLAMNIALASGKDFLGRKIAQPERVIYVALEGHRAALRARIGALARGMNLDPDGPDLNNLHLIYKPPKLNLSDPSWALELLTAATAIEARMLTVDVLRAAARIKENDQAEFSQLRDNLRPLTDNLIAVCLLHHFTKLSDISRDRAPGERMSGTGAMFGALDVGIYITQSTDNARRLRIEYDTRDIASPPTMNIELIGEGTGEHGGLTYLDQAHFNLLETPPDPDEALATEMRNWIISQGGDVPAKHLRAYFEISDETLTRKLGKLMSLGVEYEGGRGKPARLIVPVVLPADKATRQETLNLPSSTLIVPDLDQVPVRELGNRVETFPHNQAGLPEVPAQFPQDGSGNSETDDLQDFKFPQVPAPTGASPQHGNWGRPDTVGPQPRLREQREWIENEGFMEDDVTAELIARWPNLTTGDITTLTELAEKVARG